jgi:uncharacterized membrane protein YgdD (TMEM256/DUF423 family)
MVPADEATIMWRLFVILGGLNALLAVLLGAFGAHGLRAHLSPQMLAVYQTGIDYHMWHALGLIFVGLLGSQLADHWLLVWAGALMLVGILLFSGSLYVLSTTGIRWFGAITPLGGTAFIAAWTLLTIAVWRSA